MNGHFRVVAALLALVALSAHFAESVLIASACPPGMEGGGASTGQVAESGAHAGMKMHGSGRSPDSPEPSRSDAPPCPHGMAGAGPSCVSATLPGMVVALRPIPGGEEASPIVPEETHGRLLVALHFRPPRA